ncbi:MAG: hypothetical protein A2537_00655 [Candidatus Magasanikbacteria bacterium RIFOXYD2_FULL_36_9]|uniref:Succinylglutamate desuccinylase/Aspartoacylase catalytic domain-containing protein n=1 Tax=Candidatus Magasanikbacteria bacterium RIFOXYD2_FULL_36_9 TaxID=1798707 RepID=A0A1F6NY76_9BACT|nr:MAG: hypothetical protein A2537_00655 [Candidatus Magasanikbacteria bacterium RIFOXYD2_FULL_36_9]
MKFVSKKISIGSFGVADFSLPILSGGDNGPKVLIVNNIHGDEVTGFFVLEKLLSLLPDKINGQINIITTANPFGLIHRQRFLPFDEVDPNRGFPTVQPARGIAVPFRDKLTNLALQHDFIIDLHSFMKPCLSAGLLLPQKDEKTDLLVRRCLNVSNADILIKMNVKTTEKRASSALGIHLIQNGKLFFVLEFNPIRQIKNDDSLVKFADGLLNILAILGLINKTELPINNLPLFERQSLISNDSGLFVPQINLNNEIKKGGIIGFLINPKNLMRSPIVSPFEGIITEIADRQFYMLGEKLATIGKKVL